MNTKTLSQRALNVIDQYEHFNIEKAVCSIPYFNNKTKRSRASLRTIIGKGSPKDIYEEVQSILIKARVDKSLLSNESLKKILTDNNIGIDCSGFVYYVLNAESEENKKGPLDKNIHFTKCKGLIGKIRCALRPVENCDVSTFADDKNSKAINTNEIAPGNIITMLGNTSEGERDHILVIHQVEYQNFIPTKVHYSHAVAYPTDGVYGTGIKRGVIEILDPNKNIIDQRWIEYTTNGHANDNTGGENTLFNRAKSSNTEVRRLY